MSENGKALARVENTKLAAYGEREEVREMADRLLALHPAAQDVGTRGMRAVAQLALLVGASPLPATNEIHVWVGKKGNIEMALGINYYRRKAAEWGGVLWKEQPRAMTQQETEEYGVGDDELGAICSAISLEDLERYRELEFSTQDIFRMAARTGTATVSTRKTSYGSYAEAKNGRPLIWTAMKRAEVDLYRALFPVQMAGIDRQQEEAPAIEDVTMRQGNGYVVAVEDTLQWPPEIDDGETVDDINDELFGKAESPPDYDAPVEGEYEEVEPAPEDRPAPEANDVDEDGAPTWPPRPWSADTVRFAVQARAGNYIASGKFEKDQAPTDKRLSWVRSSLAAITTGKVDRHTVTLWLFGKESTNDLGAAEVEAICRWIDYKPVDEDGEDWQPNPDAIQEAANIIRTWQIQKGQQSLFPEEEE